METFMKSKNYEEEIWGFCPHFMREMKINRKHPLELLNEAKKL